MKLYAFSDFHLSGDPPTKPMDIFGAHWKNHREKIITAWLQTIQEDDTVIMAGDLSWAMNMDDAIADLKMLGRLPGRKIVVRGNHIIAREEGRLERSLQLAEKTGASRMMAVLHYPPFDEMRRPSHMIEIMKKYHVTDCIYGHIHGAPNFVNLPEELEGIKLHLTSADYVDFKPHFICDLEDTHV